MPGRTSSKRSTTHPNPSDSPCLPRPPGSDRNRNRGKAGQTSDYNLPMPHRRPETGQETTPQNHLDGSRLRRSPSSSASLSAPSTTTSLTSKNCGQDEVFRRRQQMMLQPRARARGKSPGRGPTPARRRFGADCEGRHSAEFHRDGPQPPQPDARPSVSLGQTVDLLGKDLPETRLPIAKVPPVLLSSTGLTRALAPEERRKAPNGFTACRPPAQRRGDFLASRTESCSGGQRSLECVGDGGRSRGWAHRALPVALPVAYVSDMGGDCGRHGWNVGPGGFHR